jgi:hypothetical protein
MRFRRTLEICKAGAGIVLGIVGAGLVPVFGMPFTGCGERGWFVISPQCGHWPEALRGFLFVLPIAVLAPARWILPVFANVLLLALAMGGGIAAVRAGEYLQPYFQVSAGLSFGYPIAVGGLVAMLPWALLRARARRS